MTLRTILSQLRDDELDYEVCIKSAELRDNGNQRFAANMIHNSAYVDVDSTTKELVIS